MFDRLLVLPVFRILISFVLILSTFVPHTSLQAAPAVQSEDANAEFMLYLPMPQPEAFEMIQGRVRPERLDIFTNRILREAALPLIAELNRQVREGKIKHYTFRPEQFAFQVRTKGGPLDDVLIKYAAMVAPVVEELPACAVQSVEALKRQVITTGMLRSSEKQDAMQAKSGAMILETKPHIELGFYSDSVTSVRGYVSPNQDVTMEVYRDGSLVITEQTKSFSDGYYYVSASYNSCPKSGYEWKIIPGDTVRISDRVAVYQMTAVRVQASVDPTKNQVYGYTNPGDYVKIDLSQYDFSVVTLSSVFLAR